MTLTATPFEGDEVEFTKRLIVALCVVPGVTCWRQNVGQIPVRNDRGKLLYYFDPGPPVGAADVSGVIDPEGWRLEIEVKSPKRKVTREQEAWRSFIERVGGVHVVVRYEATDSLERAIERCVTVVQAAVARRRCKR